MCDSIDDDDKLREIRESLAQVRFEQNPPWGIKALFTACFRLVTIAERQRVELANLQMRLLRHEQRLRGIEVFEASRAKQVQLIDLSDLDNSDVAKSSEERGFLDAFRR